MKLSAKDTALFLKAPQKHCKAVLLYGPDGGLVRERSRSIAATALGKDSDPLNRIELTSEQLKADPALLRDELCALSLMGGQRVITIRDAGEKLSPLIAEAFEGINTTTYLIVEAGELPPSAGLRALFEKDARFAALACYRDEGRTLEDTIRGLLGAHGLHASSDALHYLSAHLGNDRGVTASEIEKIALYMGDEKELTLEIAQLLTNHNGAESMEDICHAVAGGAHEQAHAMLMLLLHEGVQPVAIIRSLLRHYQRLDIASAHIQSGQSPDQAISALRPPVFFKYAPLLKRELSRLGARAITQSLALLLRAEKELKSSLLPPHLLAGKALQQAALIAHHPPR